MPRNSVYMQPEIYELAREYARLHSLPLSQFVAQAVSAAMSGALPLAVKCDPRTRDDNGRFRHRSREAAPSKHVYQAIQAARRERIRVMTAYPEGAFTRFRLELPPHLYEDISAAAQRQHRTRDQVGEAAIVAMVDDLERNPTSWCRGCTETIERCDCAVSTPKAARRAM